MAAKYVWRVGGHDSKNSGDSTNYPYATIAKAISVSGEPIYLQADIYNEGNLTKNTTGINKYNTIVDGTLLLGLAIAAANKTFTNIRFQKHYYLIYGNYNAYVTNCIFNNNDFLSVCLFQGNFYNNLFYDNTKNAADSFSFSNLINNLNNNTFINGQIKFLGSNCGDSLKYHIYADFDLEIDTITSLKYSLFYGHCQLKKTGGAFVALTEFSDLTDQDCGAFEMCQVFPNIAATVADNGSGKLRVTKTSHGLINGDKITIRVADDDSYLIPEIPITKITDNTFDVDITFVALATDIEYNVPLFVNEFKKDFRVLPGSIACRMNYNNPSIPIGSEPVGIEYPLTELTTLTNIDTETNGDLILGEESGDGYGSGEQYSINSGKRHIIKNIFANEVFEYENGRYIDSTPNKSETTFDAGETLTVGFYVVEEGGITYNGVYYDINEKLYVDGTPDVFTTTEAGILRLLNEWVNKQTIKCKFKKNGVWSDEILLEFGVTPMVNHLDDDVTQKITYGNADTSYDAGNAFELEGVDEMQIMEVRFQSNALK